MTDVLVVLSTLAETGPVNQVYSILSGLDKDISASILTLSPEGESSRLTDFESLGIEVQTLGLGRIESIAIGIPRLREVVNQRKPDIVHTHGLRADLLAALLLHQIPTMTTLHTNPRKDYTESYGLVRGEAAANTHLLATRLIDCQVACSSAVADDLELYLPRAEVIRNGVCQDIYKPLNNAAEYRRKLQLPDEGPLFMSAGAFIKRKRPEMVIRAFQSSSVDGHLVMLGDGPLHDQCRSIAGDSITLPGYVDEVLPYLQAADFYVSASAAEGLPLAPLEALGCGLPVALSHIKPHEEILSLNERAGILYNPNDASKFAAAFQSLLEREYESASTAARAIVTDHLNSSRMAAEYSELYRQLSRN